MTSEVESICEVMRVLNTKNGWSYTLHRDEILERYKDDPYVKKLQVEKENVAFVVDRLRVLLLRDEGGVYCDADCRAVRPFSVVGGIAMAHWDFMYGARNPHRPGVALHRGIALVDNTVLGSAKNGRMINQLCDLYKPSNRQWLQNGVSIGHAILGNEDWTTMGLNYRYFYADSVSTETIVLHDTMNFASWLQHPEHQIPRLVAV